MGDARRFLGAVLTSACVWGHASGLPVSGSLPAGAVVIDVAKLDGDGPVAVDAAGARIAYADRGLWAQDLATGARHRIDPRVPRDLAWSPDGQTLAAAFDREDTCQLQLFNAEGAPTNQASVPGRSAGLAWRADGALLSLTLRLDPHRFGTTLAQVLHQWDGHAAPTSTSLGETTLMPGLAAKLEGGLARRLTFTLSPLQDELLYYRLYNPPALPPQLKLQLRHLGNGRERTLAKVELDCGGAAFSGAGDRILYGTGLAESRLVDPWEDRVVATLPVPGRAVALSPSGRTLLLDGQLFRDGRRLASFPPECTGTFTRGGGDLYLVHRSRLYRVSKLPVDPVARLDEAEATRIRQLRSWLSEGLISFEDYRAQRAQAAP